MRLSFVAWPRWIALALCLGTLSCATTAGLRQEPLADGVERHFEAPMGVVLDAAREAIVEAGLSIESAEAVDRNVWVIIGQKDSSAFSWGELVRVVVEPGRAPDSTTVRVLTKRRMATNVTAEGDHSSAIFAGIALRLASGG